jgi:hypothetical protein
MVIRSRALVAILATTVSVVAMLACGNAQFSGSGTADDAGGGEASTASDSGNDGSVGSDGGTDASNGSFRVTLSPTEATVVLDASPATVAIAVNRVGAFSDDVSFDIDVSPVSAGVDVNVSTPANTGIQGTSSSFDVSVSSSGATSSDIPDVHMVVTGTSSPSNVSASATLTVHVLNGTAMGDAG